MTNLRDLLELLYLARTRWKTARFAMDDWTHLDRQQDAYERSLGLEGSSPPHSYGEIAGASRTWIAADGRFRQERERMTLVYDGTRTWIATPESGVVEHESRTTRPIGEEFLDSAVFLPGFDLRIAGEAKAAGRRALAVDATPRPRGPGPVELFPYGADALSLAVDRELGVILRFEASAAAEPIRRLEVTEIAFDEPLGDGLFAAPAGDVRSADEAYPVRHVTLEQAARDTSFQLWAPAHLAGRWHLNVIHRPETTGPWVPESVILMLYDSESLHDFVVEQAGEPLLGWRTGEEERTVEVDGVQLRVIGGNRLPGPPLEVQLVRGGTHIRVYSHNLDEDALVELATALEPAPTEGPPLTDR
ncbi:MAG TPA: hypothetical protein VK278_06910 [Gaiellaceae bacterium]|nr:hypothetical protein [Gaiellaceae bacterium]